MKTNKFTAYTFNERIRNPKPIYMKKPPRKNKRFEPAITASMEETCMLQLLVETLAETKTPLGYARKRVERGWRAIDTSSLEARVSGDVNFSHGKTISKKFVTGFVFTCIREKKGKYDLTWSTSLS